MDNDPLAYLRAAHGTAEALALATTDGQPYDEWTAVVVDGDSDSARSVGEVAFIVHRAVTTPANRAIMQHIAAHDPAAVLRRISAERKLIERHEPEWDTVEWPDDQNGKGEAQVCRSCGNRDIDSWMNWRPAVGDAGVFPPGVKPPYIIAPCDTIRAVAEGWGWTGEATTDADAPA